MNEKGFTLIEVIATISILLLIAIIAVPSIVSIRNKNETDNIEEVKNIIVNAAENYILLYNLEQTLDTNQIYCITLKELLNKELIKKPNISDISDNSHVKIEKTNDNQIHYEFSNNTCSNTEIQYEEKTNEDYESSEEEINEVYEDNTGANPPDLVEGMIPVKYSNGNWVVANVNEKWYDYNNKEWANAVTTSDARYRTASPGTTIPISAINSMWVWIPRFKYRITFQTIGVNYSNSFYDSYNVSPDLIDIVFEYGTNTTGKKYKTHGETIDSITKRNISTLAISEYYTHPAFRNGSDVDAYKNTPYDLGGWDKELTGFWVGKFETSGSSTTPTIIPNQSSLTNQTVSAQISTAKKFTELNNPYGLSTTFNSHMMKNTEWGAVAYLSHSKYGKEDEICANTYHISGRGPQTGYSSGTSSWNAYDSNTNRYWAYAYDGKKTNDDTEDEAKGYCASTTGNIYGIYDTNGGASERVNGGSISSGCSGTKECDYYSDGSLYSIRKLGDATFETRGWYQWGYFRESEISENEYFTRGGNFNAEWGSDLYRYYIPAGIFSYSTTSSRANDSISFRTVLIP